MPMPLGMKSPQCVQLGILRRERCAVERDGSCGSSRVTTRMLVTGDGHNQLWGMATCSLVETDFVAIATL